MTLTAEEIEEIWARVYQRFDNEARSRHGEVWVIGQPTHWHMKEQAKRVPELEKEVERLKAELSRR
jgi:uncharacterized small protein (DUF1192 family)